MRFVYDLVVPADTTPSNPEKSVVPLLRGTIVNAGVWFRAGPHNQVDVVVLDKNLQIVPSAAGTSIIGNDVIYRIPMNYELDSEPFVVTLLGWSPDTTYDHRITFFFDLDPAELSEKSAIEQLLKAIVPQGR